MKKFLLLSIFVFLSSEFSFATSITFTPENGEFAHGCLVATDIIIDTENKEIAATDIIIESSLEFVNFVPSEKMFPYFLTPKIKNNLIHLVGFTVDPKHRIQGNGSIGTLYLKQRNTTDVDGVLKLYFKKQGDTTDSNLSIAGGVDILDSVGSAYFTFTNSGTCLHPASDTIEGGIANIDLDTVITKVHRDQFLQKRFNRKTISIFTGIIILLFVLYLYYKYFKKGKK